MSLSSDRLERVRSSCACFDLGVMCIRNTTNIAWITGFEEVFDEEQAHALLLDVGRSGRVVLHTDSRYESAARHAAADTSVEVSAERMSHAKFAVEFLDEICAEQEGDRGKECEHAQVRLGIEDSITLGEYRKFEKALSSGSQEGLISVQMVEMVETDNMVLGLRAVKDADEIERLRAAQEITDVAFSYIVGFMRPGMSEREIQLELEHYMRANGASGVAFPSIVAAGANGANPHAIASNACLEAGQCVVLDFGAKAGGYCADITRTVFLGEPDDTMRAAWETMRRANEEVQAYLCPGITGRQAHELAECILSEGGFGGKMGHGLGHGVGMEVHEEPVLSPRNERELVVGNVVTVEPGIYLPGEFGMRLEDFGVITEDGFETITQSTHDMVVI